MIDPGHGGVDPGAIGLRGTFEKRVTLSTAKTVKHALEVSGRYIVKLTRYRDIYVPLRDRFAKAEQAGADLFISLHADLIRKRLIRGASVYTLSEKASDSEAGFSREGKQIRYYRRCRSDRTIGHRGVGVNITPAAPHDGPVSAFRTIYGRKFG